GGGRVGGGSLVLLGGARGCGDGGVEVIGDLDDPGAQPLGQPLGLRVPAVAVGDALAQQPVDDEVHRAQPGQFVALDGQVGGLGQQATQLVDGERVEHPPVGLVAAGPQADVGGAALVAGAGPEDVPERTAAGGTARRGPVGQGCAVGVEPVGGVAVAHLRGLGGRRDLDAGPVG